MQTTEERLTRVEIALENFIQQVGSSLDRLSMEMQDFKDEMRQRDQQRDKEMQAFKAEMQAFREELRQHDAQRDKEMQAFKAEMQGFKKEMNQQWSDLAKKMGTIVEDIIYPGIEPIIRKYFKREPHGSAIRCRKKRGALKDEFDIIIVTEDMVFMVEVKSAPDHRQVMEMEDKVRRFQQLFPEYRDKKLVTIFAALAMGEDMVNLCTKKSYYALAYRQWDYLDILNFKELSEKKEEPQENAT
jgi:hypothetical protein